MKHRDGLKISLAIMMASIPAKAAEPSAGLCGQPGDSAAITAMAILEQQTSHFRLLDQISRMTPTEYAEYAYQRMGGGTLNVGDFHRGPGQTLAEQNFQALINSLKALPPDKKPRRVMMMGDFIDARATGGLSFDEKFRIVLDTVVQVRNAAGVTDRDMFIVIGNHDIPQTKITDASGEAVRCFFPSDGRKIESELRNRGIKAHFLTHSPQGRALVRDPATEKAAIVSHFVVNSGPNIEEFLKGDQRGRSKLPPCPIAADRGTALQIGADVHRGAWTAGVHWQATPEVPILTTVMNPPVGGVIGTSPDDADSFRGFTISLDDGVVLGFEIKDGNVQPRALAYKRGMEPPEQTARTLGFPDFTNLTTPEVCMPQSAGAGRRSTLAMAMRAMPQTGKAFVINIGPTGIINDMVVEPVTGYRVPDGLTMTADALIDWAAYNPQQASACAGQLAYYGTETAKRIGPLVSTLSMAEASVACGCGAAVAAPYVALMVVGSNQQAVQKKVQAQSLATPAEYKQFANEWRVRRDRYLPANEPAATYLALINQYDARTTTINGKPSLVTSVERELTSCVVRFMQAENAKPRFEPLTVQTAMSTPWIMRSCINDFLRAHRGAGSNHPALLTVPQAPAGSEAQ